MDTPDISKTLSVPVIFIITIIIYFLLHILLITYYFTFYYSKPLISRFSLIKTETQPPI